MSTTYILLLICYYCIGVLVMTIAVVRDNKTIGWPTFTLHDATVILFLLWFIWPVVFVIYYFRHAVLYFVERK